MKDFMKNILYTGAGAAFLTKEKIEALRDDLLEKGKLSQEEGKAFVHDLGERAEKAKVNLEAWVNTRVEEKIAALNLARAEEVAELRKAIEDLQQIVAKQENETTND